MADRKSATPPEKRSPVVGLQTERVLIAGLFVSVVLQFRADGTITWKEMDTP